MRRLAAKAYVMKVWPDEVVIAEMDPTSYIVSLVNGEKVIGSFIEGLLVAGAHFVADAGYNVIHDGSLNSVSIDVPIRGDIVRDVV